MDTEGKIRALRDAGFGLLEAKRIVATKALRDEIDSLGALSTGDDIRKVLHRFMDWVEAPK